MANKKFGSSVEQVLLQIALDLNVTKPAGQHYQNLIDRLQQVLPCDASALFILDPQENLVPVAINGLSKQVLGQVFQPQLHPRLAAIISSRKPVRFPEDSPLPDPFDGLLSGNDHNIEVHSCMGCSLFVDDTLVGALTIDAKATGVFEQIADITIETFAALAAVSIRNISLFDALKKANLEQESINKLLINEARTKSGKLLGNSPQMKRLKADIAMVAPSNYAVLISGETGTGKELVAHAIHAQSLRNEKPMVYVNCAALPESIAESELFGHVKGAFTGANNSRKGKFELADGGTIFLDEIGELPLLLQAKLLRVIQQGEVQRVGSDHNTYVDVRIIAATNRNLQIEVTEGRFRPDLYHRLNVFPIDVPPLRARVDDIPILVGHILETIRRQFHLTNLHIAPEALQYLKLQQWLGNVRELEHAVMRSGLQAIQNQANLIELVHFGSEIVQPSNNTGALFTNTPAANIALLPNASISMRLAVEEYQKQLIEHALQLNNGVWAKAAIFLQMDRGNLFKLGKKLGVNAKNFTK